MTTDHKTAVFFHDGQPFIFTTRAGVFAKEGVDAFSVILVDAIKTLGVSGDVLDLGCGYGVIGILTARLFPGIRLCQSDINTNAVELTRRNAEANGVNTRVIYSDGYENWPNHFDWVLMNPPIHAGKEIIYRLFRETQAHLNPGGRFVTVIHKKHGAASALAALPAWFSDVQVIYKKKGVHVIMCAG